MDGIKKAGIAKSRVRHASSSDHKTRVQKSETLNRRFVTRGAKPAVGVSAGASAKLMRASARTAVSEAPVAKRRTLKKHAVSLSAEARVRKTGAAAGMGRAKKVKEATPVRASAPEKYRQHATVKTVNKRLAKQGQTNLRAKMSTTEMKERSVQRALRKMQKIEQDNERSDFLERKQGGRRFWQRRGFAFGLAFSALVLVMAGYLVSLNMPDISIRVAAMQTGIEKIYPSYVPLGYKLDGNVKNTDEGVEMRFKSDDGGEFVISAQKSEWDSASVRTNYVKKNWGEEYSTAKGQGLTIFVAEGKAAWVNGGVLYVIESVSGELSEAELHDIAVSL